MDEDELRTCARYVGLNPVRAGLTPHARDWPRSSARAHLGEAAAHPLLTLGPPAEWIGEAMPACFDEDVEAKARRKPRRASSTGRPLGAADWVKALEASSGLALLKPLRGRPPVKGKEVAERGGFEPPVSFHPRRISSAVHSTTLPPLREARSCLVERGG